MGSKKKSNGTPCGRGTAAEARSCADHRHPPAIRGGPRPCTERVGGARRKPRRGQGKRRGVAAATASPAAPAAAPQDKPLPLPDQHEAAHPTPGVYNAGKEEGLGQSSSGVGRTKEDVMRTDEQELPQGGVPCPLQAVCLRRGLSTAACHGPQGVLHPPCPASLT